MSDPTEAIRRQRIVELNEGDTTRAELEQQYGEVWSTDEMTKDFDALGFSGLIGVLFCFWHAEVFTGHSIASSPVHLRPAEVGSTLPGH